MLAKYFNILVIQSMHLESLGIKILNDFQYTNVSTVLDGENIARL